MSLQQVQSTIEQWSVRLVRERKKTYVSQPMQGPHSVKPLLSWMKDLAEEQFVAVYLNARHEPIGITVVSHGTASCSLVHPREVFKGAVLANAHCIIVAHNHPSGNATPSGDDITTTEQLIKAGEILGISVLDHFVVGDDYHSIRESHERLWR